MNNPPENNVPDRSRALTIVDNILYAVILSALALRVTVTEGLNLQSTSQPINIGGTVLSLTISAVLIFAFVLWVVVNICSRQFCFRKTFLEIGILLFVAAAVVASFNASNKRAAITESIITIAPMLMAVLLVQLLNSHFKIKLLLVVFAALGVVQSYQCSDQLMASNQLNIQQYEESPDAFLAPLGIQPGTFQQWLFEHRLYTKAVSGFFTNKNSVGCFLIMAAFAGFALFAEKLKAFKQKQTTAFVMLCSAAAVAFI
ncbi:MAG: hypothetical protein ACYTE8_04140, partial [Planctomycetota bacterium]